MTYTDVNDSQKLYVHDFRFCLVLSTKSGITTDNSAYFSLIVFNFEALAIGIVSALCDDVLHFPCVKSSWKEKIHQSRQCILTAGSLFHAQFIQLIVS